MLYLISPHGQYVGTLVDATQGTPPNHTFTELPPPRPTDYWNGTEWVSIGTAPSPNHKYSYETKTWKDTRSLATAKQEKWEAIKLQRNQIEFSGFMFQGKKYDSDQISQVRIIAAVTLGEPITWTLADSSTVELNQEQLVGLGKALAIHVTSTHARGRVAKQLIDQATTNEEVDAVIL